MILEEREMDDFEFDDNDVEFLEEILVTLKNKEYLVIEKNTHTRRIKIAKKMEKKGYVKIGKKICAEETFTEKDAIFSVNPSKLKEFEDYINDMKMANMIDR
jgi:hypothetical protein